MKKKCAGLGVRELRRVRRTAEGEWALKRLLGIFVRRQILQEIVQNHLKRRLLGRLTKPRAAGDIGSAHAVRRVCCRAARRPAERPCVVVLVRSQRRTIWIGERTFAAAAASRGA
jgi:hypothetical protein